MERTLWPATVPISSSVRVFAAAMAPGAAARADAASRLPALVAAVLFAPELVAGALGVMRPALPPPADALEHPVSTATAQIAVANPGPRFEAITPPILPALRDVRPREDTGLPRPYSTAPMNVPTRYVIPIASAPPATFRRIAGPAPPVPAVR